MVKKILSLLVLFLLIPSAFSIGIVSDYLEGGYIPLEPGESRLWGIRLQNPHDQEISVRITYDETHLSIIDEKEVYVIPPKGKTAVTFNVSIPVDSAPKDEFVAFYTVQQLGDAGDGVGINLNIAKGVKVRVIREEGALYLSDLQYVVAAIILLIVGYFVYLNFYSGKEKKKVSFKPKKRKRKR